MLNGGHTSAQHPDITSVVSCLRAFRIGQTKDVVVHKMVCTGTIEERIDTLISSKKELSENVIGAGGETWITELGDKELMELLRLKE